MTLQTPFLPPPSRPFWIPLGCLLLGACGGPTRHVTGAGDKPAALPPSGSVALASSAAVADPDARLLEGLERCDDLIQPGERHFEALWRVTRGGENAEAYFSFAGDRLVLQRRFGEARCDRIHVTVPGRSWPDSLRQVSSGRGVTTCAYFLPDDARVLFASTQAGMADCPPPLDYSQGYVWKLHPEYELWVRDLASGTELRLTDSPGYDAEATVSPRGDRIVFTSMRTGDPELWTCDLAGGDLQRVTHSLGYDGGAFFSHDGRLLVFRHTVFGDDGTSADRATYTDLLRENKVRPHSMELALVEPSGANRRQLTRLGGANFAPFFFPDDRRVIFSSNHHEPTARNFDLFAVAVDGGPLERITHYQGFDSFPMFSPSGALLAFASNRGGDEPGETNIYVARWR
jgi:hypothetical protein